VPLVDDVCVGGWRFRRTDAESRATERGAWLPADRALTVRAWRAGDRMRWGEAARRVKRFFADARVPGRDRPGWPVVLAGGEIVWIPGVRRSDAATDRPGQPGVHFLCERIVG
jgi:tRNA(Ile)-lysidine synthase